ncbi:MAG: SprT family zinc-dependent metalloprotease, partial [Prosthecobacter sp.]|nr:SprT family zinc-dependent metalloprotease [Prosthecobacter sp.]
MLKFVQSLFDFQAAPKRPPVEQALASVYPAAPEASPAKPDGQEATEDLDLTDRCRQLLDGLDLRGAAGLVQVVWNARLRSTAGYASYPAWRIELNPRLHEFEGQVDRTLRHELAHLVAYHRVGRKRIEPHGAEWRRACVDLGIPDETARHRLPLPRREVSRNYTYVCPNCAFTAQRVRKFRRFTACSDCCSKFNGGLYDGRFRFVLVEDKRAAAKAA